MDKLSFNDVFNYDVNSLLAHKCKMNERIKNSFVTKLEPHHYPDETMSTKILSLLHLFCHSDSIKEIIRLRKEIVSEIENMQNEISKMRGFIFNIVNRNTDKVYGILKDGFTIHDRDQYIKKVMSYHEIECKVNSQTHNSHEGYFHISVPKLGYHHSSALWGDMVALENLMNGKYARLPDLTYNVGTLQFG